MKAVQFNKYGGPEVLQVVEVDEPHAVPGEVRIAVRAAGVNPSDWKRLAGQYREFEELTFPSGIGVEASGIVDEVGAEVPGALSRSLPEGTLRPDASGDDRSQPCRFSERRMRRGLRSGSDPCTDLPEAGPPGD